MQSHLSVSEEIWRTTLIRGIIAIIFGLLAIAWPHLTFILFMRIFGIFAIVEGFMLLGGVFTRYPARRAQYAGADERERSAMGASEQWTDSMLMQRANRPTMLFAGLLSIICGLLALILPGVVGLLALYAVAFWALFEGIGALIQAGRRGWLSIVVGVLDIILALIIFFNPLAVARSLLWVIGVFALVIGIALVLLSVLYKITAAQGTPPAESSY